MDRRLRGDTLVGEMEERPEAIACWDAAKCAYCRNTIYDKRAYLCEIKNCLDILPLHV